MIEIQKNLSLQQTSFWYAAMGSIQAKAHDLRDLCQRHAFYYFNKISANWNNVVPEVPKEIFLGSLHQSVKTAYSSK